MEEPRIALERNKDGSANWEGIGKATEKTSQPAPQEKDTKGEAGGGLPITGLSVALADRLDESKEAETARLIARSSEQLIRRLDLMLANALQETTYQDAPEQPPGRTHHAEQPKVTSENQLFP